jgi:hypothetical protein
LISEDDIVPSHSTAPVDQDNHFHVYKTELPQVVISAFDGFNDSQRFIFILKGYI